MQARFRENPGHIGEFVMQKIFDRFLSNEEGNAVIDWFVLIAGMVLLALSVVLTITSNIDHITEDTIENIESMESKLPS